MGVFYAVEGCCGEQLMVNGLRKPRRRYGASGTLKGCVAPASNHAAVLRVDMEVQGNRVNTEWEVV